MISSQKNKSSNFFDFLGITSLILFAFLALPVVTGDTAELIKGSTQFFECLKTQDETSCSELERFGFTPHLISALLLHIYPNSDVVIVLWSILSFISFLILIFILKYYYYSKEIPLSTSNTFFIGTIFSPIIAYSVYSFSESFFILISIISFMLLIQKKYYLASLLSIFTIAYKDNSFLILVPLSIAILLLNKEGVKTYLIISIGWLTGLFLSIYFNILRFEVLENTAHIEGNVVFNFIFNFNNFIGVWLSPSGGALGYFFILPLILIITYIAKVKKFNFLDRLGSLLILSSVFLTTLNLAFWYSPFGWIAWGPRLILPSLILFIFVSFLFLSSKEIHVASKWGVIKNGSYLLVTYFSFLSAGGFLINAGIWFKWRDQLVADRQICSEIPSWNVDPVGALGCNVDLTWNLNSLPLFSIKEILVNWNNSITSIFFIVLVSIYFFAKFFENIKAAKD